MTATSGETAREITSEATATAATADRSLQPSAAIRIGIVAEESRKNDIDDGVPALRERSAVAIPARRPTSRAERFAVISFAVLPVSKQLGATCRAPARVFSFAWSAPIAGGCDGGGQAASAYRPYFTT